MFVRRDGMIVGRPLRGWTGHFFHSANMTFAIWELDAGALPLHEHHHPNEEVWNIVDGEIALTIGGVEQILTRGMAAIVPPSTPHSARPLGAARVIVTDFPVRHDLPGVGR
ncbi:MAG TPA: cupin domain-containing protein [Kofleriaceae bacterium]|jgi:mannose-6-phosphate isomerase-like protein (cupin superfamily)|nr:cupin domain-containing protein [Kofleriaceae bacterium]